MLLVDLVLKLEIESINSLPETPHVYGDALVRRLPIASWSLRWGGALMNKWTASLKFATGMMDSGCCLHALHDLGGTYSFHSTARTRLISTSIQRFSTVPGDSMLFERVEPCLRRGGCTPN